jgi:pimeloyl-ACP methyl ester carboxylesterase
MSVGLKILWIVLACFGASLILFYIASFFIISYIVFAIHFKRKKGKWTRECSSDEPLARKMYDTGVSWAVENETFRKEVEIVNEGLRLKGHYFDFGHKKAVIVVPGRTEAVRYGYYFGKPYSEAGFNVLTLDQRAHGESDGKYNTLGFAEARDVLAWGKYLHEIHGVEIIVLHGNCIGCSTSLRVLTDPDCPEYFVALVAEGMYRRFYDSFEKHMIELNRPVHPCIDLVDMWMRLITKSTMKFGPLDMIHKLDKPILMLNSLEDAYSVPEGAQELYDLCNAPKRLVWFEKGAHSQVRVNAPEKYDAEIQAFLKEYV